MGSDMPDGGEEPFAPDRTALRFGRFVLCPASRVLLENGATVELGSRAFEVLLMFAESGGTLVTKSAVFDRVWAGLAVEDNNLQVQVSTLRRVLGADRDWIVTIPGQGYRFTAPVTAAPLPRPAPAVLPPIAAASDPPALSLLVLPFASRGGHPGLDWIADGITDSLTTDLARALPSCAVIAQTTANTFRGRAVDVRELGRTLGVRFVLEGSVMQVEQRLRVNAQLIQASTGAHVWAERFDKPAGNALRTQDEIVARLSRTIGLQMITCEARRAERTDQDHPQTSTAADFVLRGHAAAMQRLSSRTRFESAIGYYARALEIDPADPDALAGIASVRVYQVVNCYFDASSGAWDTATREAHLREADDKLAQVLTAMPNHPLALKTRAVALRARGLFTEALVADQALMAQNPSDPVSYRETGLNMLYLGRTEEAVAWFRRAEALSPADPSRWTWLQGLGRALMQLGRDAEAVEALRLAIESNPVHAPAHAYLAAALLLVGDREGARIEWAEFRQAEPAMTLEALSQRSPVPVEATAPAYRQQNQRVLDALRAAGTA